jgi:hypothetical protein
MATALDLISESYRIAGVLGNNETANAWQADQGLVVLNDMLDLFSIDRTYIYSVEQNNFSLTSGTASYTIGSGGTFNMARPPFIDNVFIRLNSIDYPLKKINNQDYDSIAYKANGEFPQYFYYDAAFPLGTIYIYGVPTTGMTIYIDTWTPLTQIATLATTVSFPVGYNTMLKYQLARRLAGRNGMALTAGDEQIANDSLAMVKAKNLPSYVMKTEVGILMGNRGYNFYTG